jgi:predicted glycosyltransferase involved in capsule biosynthesis
MFSYQKQSGNFATWALTPLLEYCSDNITAIICIRAHKNNPWVLDRLRLLAEYYKPAPRFLIIDFGSPQSHSEIIKSLCELQQFTYHRIDDIGLFSLSIARNEGASRATTDLLYFTDIDFVSPPGHFENLARYASEHDFSVIRDIVLNLPAYHLTETRTSEFAEIVPKDRSRHLAQLGALATERPKGEIADFIAPYSNNFLCTRDFFMITGGYDSVFRGHGSEDFELMIRFALYTRNVELPADITADCHSPARDRFFKPRPYLGFRRLGEAVSFRAENHGLRVFHLWHPRSINDPWHSFNDLKRNTFRSSVTKYLEIPAKLASVDHLPRSYKALCVCKDMEHYGYFLPFRALGYELNIIPDDSDEQIAIAKQRLKSCEIDLFMIFNPYMKSHSRFHELYQLAKESGIQIVIVERGALPSSIYYAHDVSYNDPDFTDYDINPPTTDNHAISAVNEICAKIRSGTWTLENLSDYNETRRSYSHLTRSKGLKIFIPLQLSDDMAVTKFVKPGQSYGDFEAAIRQTAIDHPEITFVVKAHPLNHNIFEGAGHNIIICKNEENVHAIIDTCDFTICYNSGVGLLSLIHGKPTVSIGNAFYNVGNTGHRADNFREAVSLITSGDCLPPSEIALKRFLGWLVTKKYSFFIADDDIREFKHRKSHGYKNIMVTHFNWNGKSIPLGRISAMSRIQTTSYINGRLGLAIGMKPKWFRELSMDTRGPIKSFFINYLKRPARKMVSRMKTPKNLESAIDKSIQGILSERYSIGYLPLPKVANTSIKHAMFELENEIAYDSNSFSYQHIHNYYRDKRTSINNANFRFVVIRDPIKRFLSAFSNRVIYHCELSEVAIRSISGDQQHLEIKLEDFPFDPDLSGFIENLEFFQKIPSIHLHTCPQSSLILDLEMFSKVYKMEDLAGLENDLSDISQRNIRFRHSQPGGPKIDIACLDFKQLEKLRIYYQQDYQLLNPWYPFDAILDEWRSKREVRALSID